MNRVKRNGLVEERDLHGTCRVAYGRWTLDYNPNRMTISSALSQFTLQGHVVMRPKHGRAERKEG